MTSAMAALEAARAAWRRTNDQQQFDFEASAAGGMSVLSGDTGAQARHGRVAAADPDPAVPYGTSCRSDGAYPERNGRIPQRLAGRTEGTPPSVPFPTGADGTSEERRPASTNFNRPSTQFLSRVSASRGS